MKYCRTLEFEQDPNYNYLKGLFISILTKNQLKLDLLFSWVFKKAKLIKEDYNIESKSYNLMKRNGSYQKRLYN